MAQLLKIRKGNWKINSEGGWCFETDPSDVEHYIIARRHENIVSFTRLIREELGIEINCPISLTYELPNEMLPGIPSNSQPANIVTNDDVEVVMTVQEWTKEVQICTTVGALNVARYQFLCRAPFTLCDTTYFDGSVSEEDQMATIKAKVGNDVIRCSENVMNILFEEEKLVLIYRFSLEFEKARGFPLCDGNGEHNLGDQNTGDESRYFNPDWVDVECEQEFWDKEITHTSNIGDLLSHNLPIEEADSTNNIDVNVNNLVNDTENTKIVDLVQSSTGSTGYDNQGGGTHNHLTPITLTGDEHNQGGEKENIYTFLEEGMGLAEGTQVVQNNYINVTDESDVNGVPNSNGSERVIIEDSSSEFSGYQGGVNNPEDVHVGMIFKTRDDFKQHMAIYAIHNKFRFRNTRSGPGGMVLRCFSPTCSWRVYAALLKNTQLYEVKRVTLTHCCSVDDRSGYQSQATHTVIGEMMRAKFAGRGGGPRPNEIREAMQGDHNVHISYWKAWRSREIALDYAKGSCGASFNLLPSYLEKLVQANPGTIAELHTEFAEGIGHRFKYMFMALSASIEGYRFMRKVVIVDGSHLRGKYAGCLLTASAQDGNYQVFPLAVAVVDGENDKAWEWFFKQLSQFIPNTEDVVFVSDRHPSIYYGIAKVYPRARHCACILHLKRNIRTYFKDKHLGYLVGKAARAYRISEFYTTFNEIKKVNASCAEYLIGIGFQHWARSHCDGQRYNVMTSNVAETWNSVLRDAREYPILSLIEYIRAKLMSWFAARRELHKRGNKILTPRIEEIVSANFEKSGGLWVTMIAEADYEVRDKEGNTCHVNLVDKTCTCYEFQSLLIPCKHAIAAATRYKIRVDSLVGECYTRQLTRQPTVLSFILLLGMKPLKLYPVMAQKAMWQLIRQLAEGRRDDLGKTVFCLEVNLRWEAKRNVLSVVDARVQAIIKQLAKWLSDSWECRTKFKLFTRMMKVSVRIGGY